MESGEGYTGTECQKWPGYTQGSGLHRIENSPPLAGDGDEDNEENVENMSA
jgi:hypothetical protein